MALADPDEWFLSVKEVERDPAYTKDNEVEALIDGKEYFDHLNEKVTHMEKGDYFYMSGWRVTPTMSITPDIPNSLTFWQQVEELIRKKVDIKAMIWFMSNVVILQKLFKRFPAVYDYINITNKGNTEFVTNIFNLVKQLKSGSDFIFDARLNTFAFSSHHQKYIILKSKNTHYAYVGGIDIAVDRWDTANHDNPSYRPKELMEGWHDAQCAIKGPALNQLYKDYKERWNERKDGNTANIPVSHLIPKPINDDLNIVASFGSHNVQILRTLVCGNVYDFKPGGSQTSRLGFEKAIKNAKYYIYLEDQYFWPSSLIDLFKQAVARNVKLILVLAKEFDILGVVGATVHYEMRWDDSIKLIMKANPDNVLVFHLESKTSNKQIYIHSKLMIIDDCYAAIGSTNQSYRSHTNDSEMHAAIVDDKKVKGTMDGVNVEVCDFAKKLRLKLWSEHLGISNQLELDDPIIALAKFPDRKKSTVAKPAKVHHTVCNFQPLPFARIEDYVIALIELKEYVTVMTPGYTNLVEIINLVGKIEPFFSDSTKFYDLLRNISEEKISSYLSSNTTLSIGEREILRSLLRALMFIILHIPTVFILKQLLKKLLNPRTTC